MLIVNERKYTNRKLNALRSEIQKGVDSLEAGRYRDGEEVMAEFYEKLMRMKQEKEMVDGNETQNTQRIVDPHFVVRLFGMAEQCRVLVAGGDRAYRKLFSDPVSVLHPFTVLPMAGQVVLLVTLFQKIPSRVLTVIGLACLGVLLVLMFAIGLLSMNVRVTISTLPFIIVAVITLLEIARRRSERQGES